MFIYSSSFGQPDFREGYIVKGGDTLKGLVRYNNKNYSESATFKPGRRKKSTRYGIDDISAYGVFGDKKYEVIDLGTPDKPEKVFGLVLQNGKIDLYYSKEKYLLLKDNGRTVLERREDVIVRGKTNKYKLKDKEELYARDFRFRGVLTALTSDCGLSAAQLQYSRRQISRLIGDYNRCKGDFVEVKNTQPWLRVGASVAFAAYSSSSMKMDSLPGTTFKGDLSPVREFNVELKFPRVLDRIGITVGFQPIKTTYTGFASHTSTVEHIEDDLTLAVRYLKIPISVKYNFGNPGYSFFVRAGAWQGKLQSAQFTTFRTSRVGGVDTTGERPVLNGYRNPSGVLLGFGYDQKIIGRMRVFGELRYEVNSGIIGLDRTARASFNFLSAFIGIGI